jgi:predicted metal-dependent hydrolase
MGDRGNRPERRRDCDHAQDTHTGSARSGNEGRGRAPRLPRAFLRPQEPLPGCGPGDEGQARRIALAGEDVDYRLVRVKRRSIGIHIGLSGLTVRASRGVTLREIESTLQQHAAWIQRRLAEWRARRRAVLPSEWKSGAPILYQGRELALAVRPGRKKEIAADLLNLTVLHPSPRGEQLVAGLVVNWLKEEAWRLLVPRVADCAARITAVSPPVKLSNARNEWGSCNRKGEIRLSWRLVQLPPALAQYVIAHEVSHLVELNHSPRFWARVETLFPGHAAARKALHEWTALLEA